MSQRELSVINRFLIKERARCAASESVCFDLLNTKDSFENHRLKKFSGDHLTIDHSLNKTHALVKRYGNVARKMDKIGFQFLIVLNQFERVLASLLLRLM